MAFAHGIDCDPWITLNIDELLACFLLRFIYALKFEPIKPNTAAPALANIDCQAAHVQSREIVKTGGTFHVPNK